MAVGGLVLSLSSDPRQRVAAERWIRADARLEEGPRAGLRLAVVALTDTLGAGHDLCQELLAHPGIDHLEVAYVAPEEGTRAQDQPNATSGAPLPEAVLPETLNQPVSMQGDK